MWQSVRFRALSATILAAFCLSGCDVQKAIEEFAGEPPGQADVARTVPPPAAVVAGDRIRIATFNIQVFGMSKLGKPRVMDVLARVTRKFDVVAIQEIRSKNITLLPQFIEMINAEGARYDYVIGPRLGRTRSKEQYAFVFDATRIEYDPASIATIEDPADLLHREPLVTTFRVRKGPGAQPFEFTLVNIHTDPDETDTELNALDDVFTAVQRMGEDDVILLGDLNVDHKHLGELGRLPGIAYVISGQTTNTRGTKSYDNIVFSRNTAIKYTGRFGVFDLASEFNLTMDEALDVSDHLPVWAEFSASESGVASRPGVPLR